jgi:hypothetical protein
MAEELESTEHSGVFDGDASDAFDACFLARGAYWTALDAAVVRLMKSTGASGVNITKRVLTVVSKI